MTNVDGRRLSSAVKPSRKSAGSGMVRSAVADVERRAVEVAEMFMRIDAGPELTVNTWKPVRSAIDDAVK